MRKVAGVKVGNKIKEAWGCSWNITEGQRWGSGNLATEPAFLLLLRYSHSSQKGVGNSSWVIIMAELCVSAI